MKNIQFVESSRGTTVESGNRSGNLEIQDGQITMSYDIGDFRATRAKTGVVTLFLKRNVKLSEAEDKGFSVDYEGEQLRFLSESISFKLMDEQTHAIRNPAAVRSEVAKCRTEFNRLIKSRDWTLNDARDWLNAVNPTLLIRGKRVDNTIFEVALNIAPKTKLDDVVTFKEWIIRRITELSDKNDPNKPSAGQLMRLAQDFIGHEKLAAMDVQDQVAASLEAINDHFNELLALHEANQEQKRQKAAATRAAVNAAKGK